jgi:hypothetical protein
MSEKEFSVCKFKNHLYIYPINKEGDENLCSGLDVLPSEGDYEVLFDEASYRLSDIKTRRLLLPTLSSLKGDYSAKIILKERTN